MKVVVIYPGVGFSEDKSDEKPRVTPTIVIPLGILYIGQFLKDQGHKVNLFDHFVSDLSINEVVNWIKKLNPDVLGFSVVNANLFTANAIAKAAKAWNPNLITIYGGYLPTFCAHEILTAFEYVDFCVRGEGEYIITELMDALEQGKPVNEILGLTFRDNGKVIDNPDRPLIEDLDSLPFPDRDLLKQAYLFHGKITTVISSRGCPFSCKFCSCWKFSRRKWRLRSMENVVEEALYLQSKGFKELIFTDDCFTARKDRVLRLCYLMKKEKLDFAWHTLGRVSQSDTQFLRTMVDAGCVTLTYGVESANQRILDYYNKRINPEMAIDAVKNARKAGIENIGAGFIIGAPTETREEVLNTIKFGFKLQKIGLTNLQHQILFVAPGTQLYEDTVAQGLLDPKTDWVRGIPAVDLYPDSLKKDYLLALSEWSFKVFLTNKGFILKEFLKSIKSSYRIQAIFSLLQGRP
ncbi:MAG: radical SAM protein [Candidatus Helarchaeota archaeon]|nr:radical SAM protein [Candidatus Helarchaeota archaeon]